MKIDEHTTFILLLRHFSDLGLWQPEAELGQNYKVICPFHADRNASLQINPSRDFFYCYADCGAKGSSLELYKACYKVLHPDKVLPSDITCLLHIQNIVKEELAASSKDPLSVPARIVSLTNTSYSSVEKLSYKEAITQARDYFYNLPAVNWYKPKEEEAIECKHYMQHRGFKSKLLIESQAKASYNANYPIIFPLLENGIFRGYVMRTFNKEIEAQRKYMYNKGFRRATCLPGKYKGSEVVLLVEGYLDCLKAMQLGVKYVAAILGAKLTDGQIKKLQKAGIKKLICGTDNDEAGNKGYKYMKHLQKAGLFEVVRLIYPKGINDFGDIKSHSKEAELVLSQLKKQKIFN